MTSVIGKETAKIEGDSKLLEPIRNSEALRQEYKQKSELVTKIQSSPYSEIEHLLDLETLDDAHRLLAICLQSFEPLVERYAFEDYRTSFPFHQVVSTIREFAGDNFKGISNAYAIVFRSALKTEVKNSSENRQRLADIDKLSHAEANASGGLLKYWFGVPDDIEGRNLATCIWSSKNQAKIGGGGAYHRKAMKTVVGWYDYWRIEEYRLDIAPGATSYTLELVK